MKNKLVYQIKKPLKIIIAATLIIFVIFESVSIFLISINPDKKFIFKLDVYNGWNIFHDAFAVPLYTFYYYAIFFGLTFSIYQYIKHKESKNILQSNELKNNDNEQPEKDKSEIIYETYKDFKWRIAKDSFDKIIIEAMPYCITHDKNLSRGDSRNFLHCFDCEKTYRFEEINKLCIDVRKYIKNKYKLNYLPKLHQ